MQSYSIGIVGLWHLGCVIAASWSSRGMHVTGFDHDGARLDKLKKGEPPLYEPGLRELIGERMRDGSLRFSADIRELAGADFVFLTYDTPVAGDDSSDPAILERSVRELGPVMKNGAILIVSSQTPVGYCRTLRGILKECNASLDIACSPENLRLGEAIECYLHPDRIILGAADDGVRAACMDLFGRIGSEILAMNLDSAEMVKHGINSFLATSIVFSNHLADICEMSEAEIADVVRGMKSDPRIGSKAYLAPGIGFSGGTLGRDLKVLESVNGAARGFATLFGIVHALNGERRQSILQKIRRRAGPLAGKAIGVLGVTYKPGTSTLRRSLPLEIVDLLLAERAEVRVFDPRADYGELAAPPRFAIARDIAEAAAGADLLLLLTEWPEFRQHEWRGLPGRMRAPLFFDAKAALDRGTMTAAGFSYHVIGRS